MTFISLAQVSLINYLNHLISPFIFQHSMFLSSSPSNYLPFCLVVLLSFYFVILSLSKGSLLVFFPPSQNFLENKDMHGFHLCLSGYESWHFVFIPHHFLLPSYWVLVRDRSTLAFMGAIAPPKEFFFVLLECVKIISVFVPIEKQVLPPQSNFF